MCSLQKSLHPIFLSSLSRCFAAGQNKLSADTDNNSSKRLLETAKTKTYRETYFFFFRFTKLRLAAGFLLGRLPCGWTGCWCACVPCPSSSGCWSWPPRPSYSIKPTIYKYKQTLVLPKEYVLVIERTASRCVFQTCVSPNLSARGGIFS